MTLMPYIQQFGSKQTAKNPANGQESAADTSEKFVQNLQALEEGELAVDVYETDEAVVIQ